MMWVDVREDIYYEAETILVRYKPSPPGIIYCPTGSCRAGSESPRDSVAVPFCQDCPLLPVPGSATSAPIR